MSRLVSYGLIPARGGSKGVPRKNLRLVAGLPLIGYSIRAALEASRLDRVVVSTDDEEIARIAVELGAEVPFLRPAHLATDAAADQPVFAHFVDWLAQHGEHPDALVQLRPTTPLKSGALIDAAIGMLEGRPNLSSVRSVTAVEGAFHPYWMFRIDEDALRPFVEGVDLSVYFRRQLLPPCYRLNGVVDVFRTRNLREGGMWGPRIGPLVVPESVALDIDTETDFAWLEFLLQRQRPDPPS